MATAAELVAMAQRAVTTPELAASAGNVSRVEYSRLQQAWAWSSTERTQVRMSRTFDAPFGHREAYNKLIDALSSGLSFEAFQQTLAR